MTWLEYLSGASSFATAVGVIVAGWQLRAAKQQAQSAFEDSLTSHYRAIVRDLPLAALLGEELSREQLDEALPTFFRYFDLCNEQVFLHGKKRIRTDTWAEWTQGIEQNFARPAFHAAWREIDRRSDCGFDDLRRLVASMKLPPAESPRLAPATSPKEAIENRAY